MELIKYVYPNVSGIPQRGGLAERWQLAKPLGCQYVEMPGDFIKNKSETERTGLDLGSILSERAIKELYSQPSKDLTTEIKYVLHTEPSLPRNDGYGITRQVPLCWYSQGWVEDLSKMIISICRRLGLPASVIEVHPGDKRNTSGHILESARFLQGQFDKEFGLVPKIMLENRTGQFISTGNNIFKFWTFLSENFPDLRSRFGIVLDIQQLYTATKTGFLAELDRIPPECLHGFHIHYRHRTPDLTNKIPWHEVFRKISGMDSEILINPEIHHRKRVADAINFCKRMLSEQSANRRT